MVDEREANKEEGRTGWRQVGGSDGGRGVRRN